ncbi:MAG TPA: type II toxin-antitoxin system Phd/YefM family antitoxin [Thermoflexia bacterium]|nr:type II toxin-antitoxin system Phd/YefM family antitoxin [Thermoflexia bacterium]
MGRLKEGPIVITRRGKPAGVLIAPEQYEELRRTQACLRVLDIARSLQGSGLSAADLFRTSRELLERQE